MMTKRVLQHVKMTLGMVITWQQWTVISYYFMCNFIYEDSDSCFAGMDIK